LLALIAVNLLFVFMDAIGFANWYGSDPASGYPAELRPHALVFFGGNVALMLAATFAWLTRSFAFAVGGGIVCMGLFAANEYFFELRASEFGIPTSHVRYVYAALVVVLLPILVRRYRKGTARAGGSGGELA